MKRLIYLIVGCISLGLGALGAIIPILPTVPFLMVSACAFAKSSKRLHNWFIGTKLYKKNFESFVNKKGMTIKTKICTIFFFTITMGLGFFMMRKFIAGRILLFIVWISHIIYFIFYIPVYKEDNKKASEDEN